MDLLAGSDDDSRDKTDEFNVNNKYAKSYSTWRRKEEKQKLIDKYGDDLDSSSEEEEEITSNQLLDKEWLRAYAVVRFKQPRLYSGEKLFNEEAKAVSKKSEKVVTLKDHERKFITEKGGVDSDVDEDDIKAKEAGPTYLQEQEEIKSSLKRAMGDWDAGDDEEDDGLLVKKTKSEKEQREEENDYLAWLKGERNDLDDKKASEELAPLKEYWSNPNLTDKEKVLRDYILNNGYMDKEGSNDDDSDDDDDAFDFDEEEDFLDQADKFEKTYNFRHEEPGGCEIKTYPRVIESSVRVKEDNRRVEKRKRKMEKKQREKEERMEEMKILQRLQREEKEEKLRKLQEIAENPDLEYSLDTDFDPKEHDRIMKKYFDDGYYEHNKDGKKPVFEEDETMEDEAYKDETDEWWNQREQEQIDVDEKEADDPTQGGDDLYAEDPGFVMDADYDPTKSQVLKKSKKETKKSKKNKKLEKAPLFDPSTKTFDEYLDEYLKNKINTLPFTYREVMPNDYGLSANEILTAKDKELNAWVSVKKMSQYRNQQDEQYEINRYRQKARSIHKKQKVLPSLAPKQSVPETSEITRPKTKKKKKKKPKKEDDAEGEAAKDETLMTENTIQDADVSTKSKKKKKLKKDSEGGQKETISTENVIHDDSVSSESKKKKKKKQKLMEKEGDNAISKVKSISQTHAGIESSDLSQDTRKKKKGKKRKHDKSVSQDDSAVSETTVQKTESKKQKKMEETKSPDSKASKESRKLENNVAPEVQHSNTDSKASGKIKKHKKKNKLSIKLDASDGTDHRPAVADKRRANQNLRKVMSASRLSSFGLGHGGKKKKKNAGQKAQD